jgi:biotin carboxylase
MRVLLLSTTTGYQIRSFGEAAQRLGLELMFASDRCDQLDDPWWDHAIPVRFHEEARSVDTVLAAVEAFRLNADGAPDAAGINGIIAVGDRPTVLAAQVAAALGLPGNPPEAARASRNKLAARAAFAAAGLHTPAFSALSVQGDPLDAAASLDYPSVLKPLSLSGSRGVMRIDDQAGFVEAFERLRRILAAPDVQTERDASHKLALVESFIPGREFAVEGVLQQGVFTPFAIFDKPEPLDGPFFEETIYVTPSRANPDEQRQILDTVVRAAAALGLRHGAIHAECRVSAGVPQPGGAASYGVRVYILEIAARPIGGLCSRALRFVDPDGGTASLEEVLLRHAVGQDISGYAREAAASGVMMIPIPRRGVYREVHGVEDARAVTGVDDILITAKPDAMLVPLPEGRSYLGFIFARGTDAGEAERALRVAHSRLDFVIDREIAVVGPP